MRLKGNVDEGKVVAVIGDGAMTGGVAFEAIHQAGGAGTPIVVVLNDNGMSISPNVGALTRTFSRMRLHPKLWHAREGVEGRLAELPGGLGQLAERLGPQLKESMKAFWAPGLFWEELDWAYTGVVDGHDVHALRGALRTAFAAERPVVVHISTVKGKGFAPAEDGGLKGMEKWHAAKPGSIANRMPAVVKAVKEGGTPKAVVPQYTQVFGEAMIEEVRRDRRVVGITAAMNSGTGLNLLQVAEPKHYFDVGIAEQQAILFASGLALEGQKPVAAIYSTFLQRAYDQIVHDVCLQELNVVFAMDRAGLVGDDGPTHHGVFDIAYMRSLPNMVAMAPRDEAMLRHMLRTALALRRAERAALPAWRGARGPAARPGRGGRDRDRQGRAAAARATGASRSSATAPGSRRPRRPPRSWPRTTSRVTVADARFVKPLDIDLVAKLATEHELLVTVEEGVLQGGFGSAVWEGLNAVGLDGPDCARIMRVGLPDRYVTHGKPSLLHEEVGFTGEAIAERIAAAIGAPATA